MAESSLPTARVSERIAIRMDLAFAGALADDFIAEEKRDALAPRACPHASCACAHEKASAMHSSKLARMWLDRALHSISRPS